MICSNVECKVCFAKNVCINADFGTVLVKRTSLPCTFQHSAYILRRIALSCFFFFLSLKIAKKSSNTYKFISNGMYTFLGHISTKMFF